MEKVLISKTSLCNDITVTVVEKAQEHTDLIDCSSIILDVSVKYRESSANCAKLSGRYYSPLSINTIDANNIDTNSMKLFEQTVNDANKMAFSLHNIQIPAQFTSFVNEYCIINGRIDNGLMELALLIYSNCMFS